jgi:hypothetical protein
MHHRQLVGRGRQLPQGEGSRVAGNDIAEALEDGSCAHAVGVLGAQVREVGVGAGGDRRH